MKSIAKSIANTHGSPAVESGKCSSTSFRDGSPNIQSHHGACALPNWQHLEDPVYTNIHMSIHAHLGVSEQSRYPSVLDVTLATKALETLTNRCHGRLRCVELGHRHKEPEQQSVLVLGHLRLDKTLLARQLEK